MNNLTLVIPAKNESESLPVVLDELKKYNLKIKIILKEDDVATIESIKNKNDFDQLVKSFNDFLHIGQL